MQYADFGERNADDGTPKYRMIGYDLDRMCSRQGVPASCILPSQPTDGHDDGPAGRDNAASAFAHWLSQGAAQSLSDNITDQIRSGFISNIIRVRGYDHASADDQLEVSWYAGRLLRAASSMPSQDASARDREWNPNDEWLVFDRWQHSTAGQPTPSGEYPAKYSDDRAYVTEDNILVAHFAEALTATGTLEAAVLTGELVRTGAVWELRNATFAGRIRADEVLASLEQVNFMGQPLCVRDPVYQAFKQGLCSYPDMPSSGPDPAGTLPCDSLSAAWNFSATQVAVVGSEIWESYWRVSRCPADESPAFDSCTTSQH